MAQGLSLTRTEIDYDEICSRNGCHWTPLLCQFGSFRITEHAAYECGHNNISMGSEIYMKILNKLHSSKSSCSKPQEHAFAKCIETHMNSTWFGRDMVNYAFACSFRIYMDSWWIKRCQYVSTSEVRMKKILGRHGLEKVLDDCIDDDFPSIGLGTL